MIVFKAPSQSYGKLLVVSVCSRDIHPSTLNNSASTGRIFVEFCIGRLLSIFID